MNTGKSTNKCLPIVSFRGNGEKQLLKDLLRCDNAEVEVLMSVRREICSGSHPPCSMIVPAA